MNTKPTGFVVYEGPSEYNSYPIVAVLTLHSGAEKLGDIPQLWILSQDRKPNAIRGYTPLAQSVCGHCPLQDNGCYVTKYRAPRQIWGKWVRGGYPHLPDGDLGRYCDTSVLRLGAFGDSAMLPFEVVWGLSKRVDHTLGYTHQWKEEWFDSRHLWLCMASADTKADVELAESRGYRWYGPHAHANAVQCPWYTRGIPCNKCKLCCGSCTSARSVTSQSHGYKQKSFEAVAGLS